MNNKIKQHNLSDYNRPRTDLNNLLPEVNRTNLVESLNHNLFNRYFTKAEFERIVGIIGEVDASADYPEFQIKEQTDFRQKNQLQPIVSAKVGNIDWNMSFEDFLTRISRHGVDTECFNEWGNSLQFNLLPPIDIDKLINYRDYFWDTTTEPYLPQYITIKNNHTWVTSRLNETMRSLGSILTHVNIMSFDESSDSITVSGNVATIYEAGDILILTNSDRTVQRVTIVSSTFNISTLNTDIVLDTDITVDFDFTTFYATSVTIISSTTIGDGSFEVSGDLTNILSAGHVFTTTESLSLLPSKVWEVEDSTYDIDTNRTLINSVGTVPSFDWGKLSLIPMVLNVESEKNKTCTPYVFDALSQWNDNMMGDVLWADKRIVGDTKQTGISTLASNVFTDVTIDFTLTVEIGDFLRIIDGVNRGDYLIDTIGINTLTLTASDKLFTDTGVSYQVYRPTGLDEITDTVEPSSPDLWELYLDDTSGDLKQYNGSSFVVVVENFKTYAGVTNGRHLIELFIQNGWSDDNRWIHRDQLETFTGKIRAQVPIIEFSSSIALSDASYSEKEWAYKANTVKSFGYVKTDIVPDIFELAKLVKSASVDEFAFNVGGDTIEFHERFGNLAEGVEIGDTIVLSDFGVVNNDGEYTVTAKSFEQLASGVRYQTTLTIDPPVFAPLDNAVGSTIKPKYTTVGDLNLGNTSHWFLEGIKNISASGITSDRNPMLDEYVSSTSTASEETIVGLNWMEQTFKADGINTPTITFDNSLHTLCLYEDYQEGDIRVYVNGIRQYGNFLETRSLIENDYIGSIEFDVSIVFNSTDLIRIELGEYSLSEVGKGRIPVQLQSGTEIYNLVDVRKIEQQRTATNQYPLFKMFDVDKQPLTFSSNIFKYKESAEEPIEENLLKRVIYDSLKRDYTFENLLHDDTSGELYLYYDNALIGDEYQSIWKKGLNNEQYVPFKDGDSWELPNQMYYNVNHENRKDLKLTELFRHFSTIISAQTTSGIYTTNSNLFYLDDNVNYGLGGTIKEHNDGFDTLLSSVFVNNVNPISMIDFAHAQYINQQHTVREYIRDVPETLFVNSAMVDLDALTVEIVEKVKDMFEKNDRLDQWFGDSTTYIESSNTGIKNWIATAPLLGLAELSVPYIVNDESMNILELVHHDGHRSSVMFEKVEEDSMMRRIIENSNSVTQTITSDGDAFPTLIDGNALAIGDYVLRNNTTDLSNKIYRFNDILEWEHVNLSMMLAETLLSVEVELYNLALSKNVSNEFDFTVVQGNGKYTEYVKNQFNNYTKQNDISQPLSIINVYRQNDPFTWNYSFTDIAVHPITATTYSNNTGSWQGLYSDIYGTPYPHREPWILQGYSDKPTWWDSEYLNTDSLIDRVWTAVMWTNVLGGIVPIGYDTPTGSAGTGSGGQISPVFAFVSVNVDSAPTSDGIGSDELLPPYWNSANSANVNVKSLYDANSQDFIRTPNANFEFGQNGFEEWKWETSAQRVYDELIVAYRIEPLRFIHQTFGYNFTYVSCLEIDSRVKKVASHEDVIFHGDFIPNTSDVFKSDGINQWYVHFNRYNGFDGVSSEFREMWRDWDNPLGYLFGAFINTKNFQIFNETFDITERDYVTEFKKTEGVRDIWIDALKSTILTVPSKYSPLRDNGAGWTVSFDTTSPVSREIEFYPPQNYTFSLIDGSSDTFRTYSYPLLGMEFIDVNGYQSIDYNQSLLLSNATSLTNDATFYTASVLVDGATVVNLSIEGQNAQTVSLLIDVLNTQLGSDASAYLKQGNIVIESETIGGLSAIAITETGLFATVDASYNGLNSPQVAALDFEKVFYIDGNVSAEFKPASTLTISSSTNLDGTYTVNSVRYDISTMRTFIEIVEDITLVSNVVDGIIESDDAKTLPDEWVTGKEVHLQSSGYLPDPLFDDVPYYIIRVNDREFSLSEIPDSGAITVSGGSGKYKVGLLEHTFHVLDKGTTDTVWRKHFPDTRTVEKLSPPLTISGIQNIVDMVQGYDAYHTELGFSIMNPDSTNIDVNEGRRQEWQLEIEKLINDLYLFRTLRQDDQLEYGITFDNVSNSFTIDDTEANWTNGTRVLVMAREGSTLPTELDSTLSTSIPYFIVRGTNSKTFQLAFTSLDARKGNYIPISDDGTGELLVQVYRDVGKLPERELNPFKNNMWIEHETGVMSDIFAGNRLDIITNQTVYDNRQEPMLNDVLVVHRRDKQSKISMALFQESRNENDFTVSQNNQRHMSGMHIFFDGYEHVLKFQDYSTNGVLIYDSFLGINTAKFALEFNRQEEFTLRPNVGGSMLLENEQLQNIEAAIDEMRYYYSAHTGLEGNETTDLVRKSMGYEGTTDYMDDMRINPKTQFTFWRGMIQNKGTNFAIDAFTNQPIYNNAVVDDFWAYKVAEFGDSKRKIYPEMNLVTTDASGSEMRIEFVEPDGGQLDLSFEPVKLSDKARWFNQPDEVEALAPHKAFFFESKITQIMDVNEIVSASEYIDDNWILTLNNISDGVIITYFNDTLPVPQTVVLIENDDYKFINATTIKFIRDDMHTLDELKVSSLSYNYDAQNPSKLIDRKSGPIITNVPLWNPALGQYYHNAIYPVTYDNKSDPANYNTTLSHVFVGPSGNSLWDGKYIGEVWFDKSVEGYLPYYDKAIYPKLDDRVLNWGTLAEWADIALYEWVESRLTPEEYDIASEAEDGDLSIKDIDRRTGSSKKLTYVNNAVDPLVDTPIWVEEKDIHQGFIAKVVTVTNTTALTGEVEVYHNGNYAEIIDLSVVDFVVYADTLPNKTYIHIVQRATVPTEEQIEGNLYKLDTPYSKVSRFDIDSLEKYTLNYFWVRNTKNKKEINESGRHITIFEAERQLKNMPHPYKILQGLKTPDYGFGLIYGNIYDEFEYDLPYRYTQMIVKNLENTVKDNSRYTMRFTKDFTLRDRMPDSDPFISNLGLKNVHLEWKLIREKQLSKIESKLWDYITESLIGLKYVDRTLDSSTVLPTLNRILFDDIYDSDSKYGLGDEQIFVDAEIALATIEGILNDSNRDFGLIDIDEFLENRNFDNMDNVIEIMNDIYDIFSVTDVNYIFFQVLHDAFTVKREVKEFFKTSWIGVEISQNVRIKENVIREQLRLEEGGTC